MAEPEARPKPTKRAESPKISQEKEETPLGLHELSRPELAMMVKLSETDEDRANVEKLRSKIKQQKLHLQVHQGGLGRMLVLIRASDTTLKSQAYFTAQREYLNGVRARNPGEDIEPDENLEITNLSPAQRIRLVYEALTGPVELGAAGITPGHGEWSFVESIYPLHNYEMNKQLLKRLSTTIFITDADIEVIRSHFGDKVAMYYAFCHFYFFWSVIPAVIGVTTHYLLGAYSITFFVLNGLWGLCFIEAWKRRQDQLALRWVNKGYPLIETRRVSFHGDVKITDAVTGSVRPYSSKWRRLGKQLAFVPIALGTASVLSLFLALVFVIEIFLVQVYEGPLKSILSLVPTGLVVAGTPVLLFIYSIFVQKTNKWENHETNSEYEVTETHKMFVFTFLASYMALFLTSYVYLPFGHQLVHHFDFMQSLVDRYVPGSYFSITSAENFQLNSQRLHQQVIYFLVTASVINFVMENIVPYISHKAISRVKTMQTGDIIYDDDPVDAKFLDEARMQADLPVYNVQDDYRQLVVQFGYSILFGPVWSLGPVAAAINNFVQLRGDIAKICIDMQRPIPERTDGVGAWIDHLGLLSWLGSITGASLIAMFGPSYTSTTIAAEKVSSSVFVANNTPWFILLAVLFSEHVYFVLRAAVGVVYSLVETHESIEDKQQRYQARKQYFSETFQVYKKRAETVPPTDPSEQSWIDNESDDKLKEEIDRALVRPKTLKEKKNE
ncbi:hypothetical protein TRVA0_007S01112 [Trichomonascus vanleenenianus]|uniref:Ist2p n=1 Tax=Trichomonascus vanleenenianus TaxID=2268995 RepID=UPI003ECA628A